VVGKIDFKRELRGLYASPRKPTAVEVPELAFLMVDGHGDPNTSAQYRDAVSALFSVSYAARFALKRAGVIDYGVMPLEGLWWVPDMATFSTEDKSEWDWTMMIRQPDAATPDLLAHLADEVATKKSIRIAKELRLISFEEGTAAQVLHVGPYATEASTIVRLHEFIREQGFTFHGHRHKHHEIYLGDPRRSAPEKLRTIIRQPYAAS